MTKRPLARSSAVSMVAADERGEHRDDPRLE
jgi:hypothetical protein